VSRRRSAERAADSFDDRARPRTGRWVDRAPDLAQYDYLNAGRMAGRRPGDHREEGEIPLDELMRFW
jgi:hypothetical protein